MHEYPVTNRIIEIAQQYGSGRKARSVTAINLVVGEDSGYVPDSIELYFSIIAKDALCENAVLNIKRTKPMLRCGKCGELFLRKPFEFSCIKPECGGEGEPTEFGREFYVESIEIES